MAAAWSSFSSIFIGILYERLVNISLALRAFFSFVNVVHEEDIAGLVKQPDDVVAFPLWQFPGVMPSHFPERDAFRASVLDHVAEVLRTQSEWRISNLVLRGLLHGQHGCAGQCDSPSHAFDIDFEVAAVDDDASL